MGLRNGLFKAHLARNSYFFNTQLRKALGLKLRFDHDPGKAKNDVSARKKTRLIACETFAGILSVAQKERHAAFAATHDHAWPKLDFHNQTIGRREGFEKTAKRGICVKGSIAGHQTPRGHRIWKQPLDFTASGWGEMRRDKRDIALQQLGYQRRS